MVQPRTHGRGRSILAVLASSSKAGTAAAGSDFTALPLTTLSFAPGHSSKTVSVNVTGDTVVEPNERFTLALSAPTRGAISDTSASATIYNDD